MEQKRGGGGGGGDGGGGGGVVSAGGGDGREGQLRAWREAQFARDIRGAPPGDIRGAPGERIKKCRLLATSRDIRV